MVVSISSVCQSPSHPILSPLEGSIRTEFRPLPNCNRNLRALPGPNKVTLAQLRTVIKNDGFVSRDATVTARGAVAGDTFEVR